MKLRPQLPLLAMAAICGLLILFSGVASAGGRYPNDCGRYGQSGKLKTKHVSCDKGRHVVGRFLAKAQGEGPHIRVKGFSCDGSTPGRKLEVFCSRRHGRQLVHWKGTLG